MAKKRIRTHANPLSYPNPIKREQWAHKLRTLKTEYICLDMGCGQGDFIIECAHKNPEQKYIGVEVRQAMSEKVNLRIKDEGLSNCICLQGNASISLKTMFDKGEVDEIIINFPDPWFKEKHKKRLIIQDYVVNQLHEILSEQGVIYLQSDVKEIYDIFEEELAKKFVKKEYPKDRVKSYWEKYHESKGKEVNRCSFVK